MKTHAILNRFALAGLGWLLSVGLAWAEEPTYRLILLHKPTGAANYQTVFSEILPDKGYAMRVGSRDGYHWLIQAARGGSAQAYFYVNADWTKDWPLWGSVWQAHVAVPEKDGLFYGGAAAFANGTEVLLLQRTSTKPYKLPTSAQMAQAAEGSPALPFDAIATSHRDNTAKAMGHLSVITPPKGGIIFSSAWQAAPGVCDGMDADAAAAAFCVGNVNMERLTEFPVFHATADKTEFVFRALEKLLAHPARPSLQYSMKLRMLYRFIAALPPEKIPDKDMRVLFEVLRVRPTPMLEPLRDWADILKRKAGVFPDFDAALARASKDGAPPNLEALTAAVDAWQAHAQGAPL